MIFKPELETPVFSGSVATVTIAAMNINDFTISAAISVENSFMI